MAPMAEELGRQVVWLLLLAIPIATVAWTITHEEVFREPRERFHERAHRSPALLQRKFFYALTCEYCLSHYVTIVFQALTGYRLLLDDFRGYVLAFFALVWVANIYMSLMSRLRVDIRAERAQAQSQEQIAARLQRQAQNEPGTPPATPEAPQEAPPDPAPGS